MAVAMMLVALPSGAALAEQFRAPESLSKPKVVKKVRRYFRPTMPERNPLHPAAAARIFADAAPSTKSAPGAEASGAAGIGSTASGQVAVVGLEPSPDDAAEAPLATASLSSDTEVSAASADDGDAAPTDPADDTASEEVDPPADSAEALPSDEVTPEPAEQAESDEATPEPAELAGADEATEPAGTESAEDSSNEPAEEPAKVAEASSPEEPVEPESVEAEQADAKQDVDAAESTEDSSDKPAEEPTEVAETTPPEAVPSEPEDVEQAAEAPDAERTAEAEPVETEPIEMEQASEPEEAEQNDEVTETAEDSSDEPAEQPTEVTETSPPEAAAEPEDVEPVAEAAEAEQTAEPVETEPNEIEPADTDQADASEEDEQPAKATETAEAPSHDATVVIDVTPPPDVVASGSQPDAETSSDDAEPIKMAAVTPASEPMPTPVVPAEDEPVASEPASAPSDTESTPSDAESMEAPSNDGEAEMAPAVETAPEVEEPPAHPVVAAIRTTLADPEYRKGIRTAALKALEGIYNTREYAPLWIADGGFSANARALIGEIGKAGDWGLDARAFDVPDADGQPATSEAQAAAELKLDMAILKYARFAQGGRLSPKRVSKLFDQRPRLSDPKVVLTALAGAETPSDALVSLHPQHEQFNRLRSALVKARARNNAAEIQRIVINMERWRWMPRQLGSFHVWNNVPEFNTRVVKNGKTVYVEKTIVGQFKYATPFFSAPMRNIVFHPDWTVPPTILNEDLAPKLQKPRGLFGGSNTAVLRNHGLSVKYKGEPVDPDEVDWPNENIHKYTFVQAPGPANVLGKFKFNFPNKHAIYMHDTPQRELFAETVRTLSHGCIRVRDPDRLANLLLAEDKGWSAGQVRSLVDRGENKVIALRRPVPVHLTYFTATVGEDGRLQTFGDIYGLDNRMAPKLFDRPVEFQVSAEPVIAEAGRRSRAGRRRGRHTGGGLGSLITGLFGN